MLGVHSRCARNQNAISQEIACSLGQHNIMLLEKKKKKNHEPDDIRGLYFTIITRMKWVSKNVFKN